MSRPFSAPVLVRGLASLVLAGGILVSSCGGEASSISHGSGAEAEGGVDRASAVSLAGELERARASGDLPAVAALVFSGDRIVARGAVGVRSAASAAPVEMDDRFHLGSCTKAMTATLAGRLVERGLLRFEATIPELFPSIAGEVAPDYRSITLDDLLRHRAGLPSSMPQERPELWRLMWRSREIDRGEVARRLLVASPPHEQGSYHYSNAGYIVAGAALERVSGLSWEELMRRELFEPLGMRSCGFGPPSGPGRLDAPWGHRREDGEAITVPPGPKADNPPSLGPAGTVHCNLEDWMRFVLVHGGAGPRGYLEPETLEALHGTGSGSYAAGWLVRKGHRGHGLVLHHAGSNTLFYATVWLRTEDCFGILLATNTAHGETRGVLRTLNDRLVERFDPRSAGAAR